MRQTQLGVSALVPFGPGAAGLAFSLAGAARFLNVRGGRNVPSIDTIGEPRAGAESHDTYGQFTAGLRLAPTYSAHVLQNYNLTLDAFMSSTVTFTRWTADLRHDFPFYHVSRRRVDGNTPNDCVRSQSEHGCPAPSRGRYGTLSLHVKVIGSDGDPVPFYFQPTLGGADVNGNLALTGFPDSRFRGPNQLLLQATIEHSLVTIPLGRGFVLPLGGLVRAEAGRSRERFGDSFSSLRRSYEAGLTIRAGGFPVVSLLYAWADSDHRFTALISPSLLGGSARPSLF
jgi:hypothetical protein